jgi:signal transduction histidine kinase
MSLFLIVPSVHPVIQQRPWGYLKVGQSLKEHDQFLAALKLCLLIGLPIAMLLVGGASWWLAGLAMRPVYRAYQQMQQFTIDAAHELRTPLAAIQATVEASLGAEELLLPEAHSTLQTIERQNHRVSQLVQDLLLLSRMDLPALPLNHQPCNLQDLVSDLVEELAALALAANLLLLADLKVCSPLEVWGDAHQLYRLLANLVTNAIQYTPTGGKVVVSLSQTDQVALIQVQDTGIGIAPAEQSRIFDRFYRVGGDRSRKSGGAGLGLAIAQAIARAHKGSIQIQSTVGEGSLFTIRLPLTAVSRSLERVP